METEIEIEIKERTLPMNSYFRSPDVEEAPRNIILQNRCGNRLTMMFWEDRTEFEFVYKPNAFRRKDYRARNFSNRDNFTTLFGSFTLPDTCEPAVKDYRYDPFVTRFSTETVSMAKNTVTVVNIADENVFAVAARGPLLLGIRPRATFEVRDGLLLDAFADRGEEIVAFVAFAGFEQNRYRVLDDGTHVLQVFENEVLLVGGEETRYHAEQAVKRLGGLSLEQLLERNEAALAPSLAKGHLAFADERFQQVLDLNRRVVYSGMDEGGACFGALNRLYHLIWNRDGSMTTSLMARSGNPDYLRVFAPFILRNPSSVRREDGTLVPEFGQILGSRWSKSEDDGIFYAFLALFTHFVTTGDDALVQGPEFVLALEALERFLEKAWEADRSLIGSDTRGESPLKSSPYYGYDVVSGKIEARDAGEGGGRKHGKKILSRCYSLYNNVNTYNILQMAVTLLRQRPTIDNGRTKRYLELAAQIQSSIAGRFVDPEGHLYAAFERYDDGSEKWMAYSTGVDYWEYAWANSLGPFYPAPELQLKSARLVRKKWASLNAYGFCPWNTVSRYLREYGMPSAAYHDMLKEEIDDALMLSPKYPMYGALGEYAVDSKDPKNLYRSWRALPFTAGSLFHSVTSLLVQSLPVGVALRASTLVDAVEQFQYRLSRLNVTAAGQGEVVTSVRLNGEALEGSLQVPERMLRPGTNTAEVVRGKSFTSPRLYSSNCELLDCGATKGGLSYRMSSAVPVQLVFENFGKVKSLKVTDADGGELNTETSAIADTGLTLVTVDGAGDLEVTATV